MDNTKEKLIAVGNRVESIFYFLTQKIRLHKVAVIFISVVVLAGLLHGHNMFKYPYFESDEGTYLSQAFSVKSEGELGFYTYWYDHPPLGWMTIAAGMDVLSEDWNRFGSSLNDGRFLMLILHLVQVSLLFFIAYTITRSPWFAFLACVLYTISPLATYFQRRILLDNLMVTWILFSVAVLHIQKIHLRHIIMSSIFFGAAVLTKVTAVMFGPAFLYLLLTATWNVNKSFRTAIWLAVSGTIVSFWFVYSIIKTEFLPSKSNEIVSLIGALQYQASRGSTGISFWREGSLFREMIGSWVNLDSTFVYVLGLGLASAILLSIFRPKYRFYAFSALLYFLFLIRGGLILDFYILPLIPFAIITFVLGLKELIELVLKKVELPKQFIGLLFACLMLVLGVHYAPKAHKYLTVDDTSNQIKALKWIKENLPAESTIVIDVYGMTELRNPSFVNKKVFNNADWYFKISKDPAIRFSKYKDDWRNFDYVFLGHEMLRQAFLHRLPVVYDVIRNSQPVITWNENSTSHTNVQNFLSTNGDWAALYRVNNTTKTQLLYAWNYYKNNFIKSYGQVIDPQAGNVTTSEGQSYGMLRAALMNDNEAFKGIWLWTQHNLQHRLDDKLISWKWKGGKQVESANATDADLDIALALIFASKIFNNPVYLEDARKIIADIWRQTVVNIQGTYYLLPGEKVTIGRDPGYLLNPSYFSPAHYRIFAEVDTDKSRNWLKLANDSYVVLQRLKRWNTTTISLPPNWVLVHAANGSFLSADKYIEQGSADYFSYDAFRIFWRVALDVEWHDSTEGTTYLKQFGSFFEKEWAVNKSFAATYDLDGRRVSNAQSLAVSAGILSAINISSNSETSSEIYKKLFINNLTIVKDEEYAYWGNHTNYYDSNWVWFGTALFSHNMTNLWRYYQ